MCCKGRKCFGSLSVLLVRVKGAIRLYTVERIRTTETPIELLTPNGWAPLTRIEKSGTEAVLQAALWPLYLTPDHMIADVGHEKRPIGERGVFVVEGETVQDTYELETATEDEIVVGPYLVGVTKREACPVETAKESA